MKYLTYLTTISKDGYLVPNCKNCDLQGKCTISDCRDKMMFALAAFESVFNEGCNLRKLCDLVDEIEETNPELIYDLEE